MERVVAVLLPVLIVGVCWLFVWRSGRVRRRRERQRLIELQELSEPLTAEETPLERLTRMTAELQRELDGTQGWG